MKKHSFFSLAPGALKCMIIQLLDAGVKVRGPSAPIQIRARAGCVQQKVKSDFGRVCASFDENRFRGILQNT
jgi:hypothetical protein